MAQEPDDERRSDAGSQPLSTGNPRLVLGIRWQSPACAERIEKQARDALALATCVGDFDCRLSAELLSGVWPKPLIADGPFEDVLLGIPVKGQAHVEAKLGLQPVADSERIAVDVVVVGVSQMQGIARSHRVQVECDATAEFRATKRLYMNAEGITGVPATCTATSSFQTKGISAKQPKLLARFSERVAQQLLVDQHDEAEEECSEHVAEAMCAAVDREIGGLIVAINAAFADFRSSTPDEHRSRWQLVRFQSAEDSLLITRVEDEDSAWVAERAALAKVSAPLILRVARAELNLQRLLLTAPALFATQTVGTQDTAANLTGRLTPSVSWQEKTFTVLMNYVPAASLAQEPLLTLPKQ